MYRYKYSNNLPKFFNDYFTQNNEIHHYNTRKFEMQTNCMFDIGERTTQNILFQTKE